MNGRLVLNGSTEIKGGKGEISATHVSLATTGYFAADYTTFWGCKIG